MDNRAVVGWASLQPPRNWQYRVGMLLLFCGLPLLSMPARAGTITLTVSNPNVPANGGTFKLGFGQAVDQMVNGNKVTAVLPVGQPVVQLMINQAINTAVKKRDAIFGAWNDVPVIPANAKKALTAPAAPNDNQLVLDTTNADIKKVLPNPNPALVVFNVNAGEFDAATVKDAAAAAALSFQGTFDSHGASTNPSVFTAGITSALGTVSYTLNSSQLADLTGSTITDTFLSCFTGASCPVPLQGSLAGIGVSAFLFGTDIDFNFTPQAASTATVTFGTDSADGTVMGSIAVATPEPATITLLGAGLASLLGFRRRVSPNRLAG